MSRRKTICCFSIRLEEVYQQRIIDGLQAQCEHYGYNLAVFAPFVDVSHFYKDYRKGELNIFKLPDFSSFDAVVLVAIPFINMGNNDYLNLFYSELKSKCSKPIIVLDHRFEDSHSIFTDDISSFYDITKHLIDVHNCRKIYFLTGQENYDGSERRKKGYIDALKDSGIPVDDKNIFYGDFWYTSGEQLANRIISGELEMPDAVACAGDHMAIGLTNTLIKNGIKVPEQVIVTGYEATHEAITNPVGITSYIPNVFQMATEAVNMIRSIIEPGMPIETVKTKSSAGFFIAESCGCKVDSTFQKEYLAASLYRMNRNYGDGSVRNNEDIAGLLESYMLENLTKAESPLECLKRIFTVTYLLYPYDHFYLCLRPNWLDTETDYIDGYPDKMRCVMHAAPDGIGSHKENVIHCRNDDRDLFDTRLMLPQLWEEQEKPCVFFFAPSHFSDNCFGYSVLQCELEKNVKVTAVFHNWMRNVNNALELTRAQNKLIGYSLADSMTKLSNRRGLRLRINDMISIAEANDKLLAMVIDMDGLKYINDTYGHNEGDYAITTIASVVRCITGASEVAARAGGDEFYILGVGKYTDDAVQEKIQRFYSILSDQNVISMKPYEITGSIGFCIKELSEINDISEAIADADSRMYISKLERKKQRN